MSFSALLGIANRAYGFPTLWRTAMGTGFQRAGATATPRTLKTLSWINKNQGFRRQEQHFLFLFPSTTLTQKPVGHIFPSNTRTRTPLQCVDLRPFSNMSAAAAGDGVAFTTTEVAQRRNNDPECVAFVTGANRGIGLEVTRQLLERTKGERECVHDITNNSYYSTGSCNHYCHLSYLCVHYRQRYCCDAYSSST